MSVNIKEKATELRTKIQTRVEDLRTKVAGGGHSPLIGNLKGVLGEGGVLKGPLVSDIRSKGVMTAAQERISKFRGGGGRLFGGETAPSTPAAPPTPKPTMYPSAAEAPERVDLVTRARLY